MDDSDDSGHNNSNGELSQERFLPIANVSRIMKKALPANAKISKDAKETVQECVSEFISFVTGEASDKCLREKRKTINGDDLLWAMTTLGFEDYVEPLKVYLQKLRDMEGERSAVAGRQGGEKDESGGGDCCVVTLGNKNGGMYGAIPSNMVMMGQHHYVGHVYGSSACYRTGNNGPGMVDSGYAGSATYTGRPR